MKFSPGERHLNESSSLTTPIDLIILNDNSEFFKKICRRERNKKFLPKNNSKRVGGPITSPVYCPGECLS